MSNIQFVKKSSNAKTGPIPTTTSGRDTCPQACPFNNGNGCYADAGYYTRMNWDKVTNGERGGTLEELCEAVAKLPEGQLWRHNVAGDLKGNDNWIDYMALLDLVKANKGRRGFTYTHYPVTDHKHAQMNVDAIEMSMIGGFTVNVSANSVAHAVQIKDEYPHLPVAAVVPSDHGNDTRTIDGVKFITCPATYKDNVTCATCKLCSVADRDSVIAFPAHGSQTKKADIIARG